MRRRTVVIINPPNSCARPSENGGAAAPSEEHSDWANYAHVGLLSLASAVEAVGLHPVYLDGVVCPLQFIESFLIAQRAEILLVGVSLLTANYESGLHILEFVKNLDGSIVTVVGNDHFTALYELCLRRRSHLMDCGFLGNEVLSSFTNMARALFSGARIRDISLPSMVSFRDGQLFCKASIPESIQPKLNYQLIDATYPHSQIYTWNFKKRVASVLARKMGITATKGVPVEIARGCIKFSKNDACSFCSIQYGGLWKNELTSANALEKLNCAVAEGYDYLYVTADELPLTFPRLLSNLNKHKLSAHWLEAFSNRNVVLAGYSRADGLAQIRNARLLRQLGFRILMVGVDAGTPISLRALNKPLDAKTGITGSEALHVANATAISNAAAVGICLRLGFVIGHLGMTPELLATSVACAKALINADSNAILSVDVELLSPEPGSQEFRYLTDPAFAELKACQLGLCIAERSTRERIASKWDRTDLIHRDEAITDYIEAMMPRLSVGEVVRARDMIRSHAMSRGILVGT